MAQTDTTSRSRVWVDARKASALILKLVEAARTGKEVEEEDRIIGTAPSSEAFSRWASKPKNFLCDFIAGKIRVREVTFRPHGAAQVEVSGSFRNQRGAALSVGIAADYTDDRVKGDTYIPDVVVYVKGQSLFPRLFGTIPPTDYVALIVEIASSQKNTDLHQRAGIFLGNDYPRTEVFISLKRFDERQDGLMAMLATVYFRPPRGPGGAAAGVVASPTEGLVPAQVISFGTCAICHATLCPWPGGQTLITGVGHGGPPLNVPGNPFYTIQIPAATLFSTYVPPGGGMVGVPPPGTPANYVLDLFGVQQEFLLPYDSAY